MNILERFRLTGRTALVTGCKRGIGKAIALGLAEAGADIVGVSATLEPRSAVEKAVTALGRSFRGYAADFSNREALYGFIRRSKQEGPPIDILVNNAGTILRKPVAEHPDEYWDKVIETNVKEVKPEKVEDPEEPPPDLEPIQFDTNIDMNTGNIAPTTNMTMNLSSSGMSSGDGEYLPIVKVAPIYPRRAQTRGISGYCIVEYVVTTTGAIRDPQTVDCQPKGIFERASLKASEKFKYKPRIVDGEPIEVAGVQNKFTFELEQ